MTTAEFPRTIRATIHPDALERVPAFFNAAIRDILNETIQNARRSGASHVAITSDGERVTVADNGRGIDSSETILAFGESHWTNDVTRREHPVGMGFYALVPGQIKIGKGRCGGV